MQIYINVINWEIMKSLWSLLFSNDKEISQWFSSTFVGELEEELSPQYEIEVKSLSEMRKLLWKDCLSKKVEWVYWWTEQCEWLVPTLKETQEAYEEFKLFNKKYFTHKKLQFSFLTSYWWSDLVKARLVDNFKWLNENARKINPLSQRVEVIVNDLWTITLLKPYKNLIPVFWRLFWKTLKMPMVEHFWWEDAVQIPWELLKNKTQDEIKVLKEKFAENQKKMLARTALHTDQFWSFANHIWVDRASLDYNERYKSMFEDHKHTIDVYYPYWIVFVWRICDTCWVKDIERSYYPLDKPCWRECTKFDLFVNNFSNNKFKTFQRWNAQYMSNVNLSAIEPLLISDLEHRLIFTPMI